MLTLLFGRGGRGKTALTRFLTERAHLQGRAVVVGDADRTNRSLGTYYEGVLSPPSVDDRDVLGWLEQLIDAQIDKRYSAILDFGGGDLVLKRAAREWQLPRILAQNGVSLLAIHLLGPDPEDLSILTELERDNLIAPERTVLILNEALVPPHRSAASAFEELVQTQPVLRATLNRGAQLLVMPCLAPMAEIERRRIGFAAAAEGRTGRDLPPLGPVKSHLTRIWLEQMEAVVAPIAGWLP
uniref:Mobilization protein MobD n=1 Tax=Methylobacterium oryzae CBMB20 TaxID=693986 RepID=A0A088B3C1_9HYPH|nr:Putative mobilization protein MobD [Methylobacterium oryzae CBMB20]